MLGAWNDFLKEISDLIQVYLVQTDLLSKPWRISLSSLGWCGASSGGWDVLETDFSDRRWRCLMHTQCTYGMWRVFSYWGVATLKVFEKVLLHWQMSIWLGSPWNPSFWGLLAGSGCCVSQCHCPARLDAFCIAKVEILWNHGSSHGPSWALMFGIFLRSSAKWWPNFMGYEAENQPHDENTSVGKRCYDNAKGS